MHPIDPITQPPPTPGIRSALAFAAEACNSLAIAPTCWNRVQLSDRLRAARIFIDQAESALQDGEPK